MQKAVLWPCGVFGRGIGNNSIHCTSCQKWAHRKYSGIKGSMYKIMKTFVCGGWINPVTGTGCTSVDIGVYAYLTILILCPLNEVAIQQAEMRMVRWMCGIKLQDCGGSMLGPGKHSLPPNLAQDPQFFQGNLGHSSSATGWCSWFYSNFT